MAIERQVILHSRLGGRHGGNEIETHILCNLCGNLMDQSRETREGCDDEAGRAQAQRGRGEHGHGQVQVEWRSAAGAQLRARRSVEAAGGLPGTDQLGAHHQRVLADGGRSQPRGVSALLQRHVPRHVGARAAAGV